MSAVNRVYYYCTALSVCLARVLCTVACFRPPGSKWIRRSTSAKNRLSVSENRQEANLLIKKIKFLLRFISLENSHNGMQDKHGQITPQTRRDDMPLLTVKRDKWEMI